MEKMGKRLLSIILALILVFELVPANTLAAEAEEGGTDLSSGAAETTGIEVAEGEASEKVLGEVDGLREESQKHFRMADGSFIAVDYGVPVHFSAGSDENGEIWEDIDNTLLLQPQEAQAAFSASGENSGVFGQNAASSYAAAGQNAALSNSNAAAASYAAVNGDDTKVFAGNLATGFLFSVQRGQTGARMSLVDGEAAQPEVPAATEAATDPETETTENAEETIVSPTEAETEVPSTELEVSGETGAAENTEETIAETDPETTEVTGTSAAAENNRAALTEQATGKETANTDPVGVSPAQAGNKEAAVRTEEPENSENSTDVSSALEQENAANAETDKNNAEDGSVSDHTDAADDGGSTEAATLPAETIPATEATEPAVEQAAYNRSAAAQISYPDRETNRPMRVGAAKPAENAPSLEAQITPTHLRTQVRYEEVYPGVDLLYELYSYHVKESILVKKPLESYSFSFRLDLQDLTPVMQEDGSVLLVNKEGTGVYLIPAPYMVDENGAYSEATFYTLTQAEDSWLLTVTADAAWMNDPERAFPVAIDPTLIDYTTAQDFTGVVCNQNNHTVSARNNLTCGYHPQHGQMEIYYKLTDLPKIPAGHTLVRAQAGFKQNDFHSGNDDKNVTGKMVLYMSEILSSAAFDSMTWANRPSRGPVLDFVNAEYSTIGMLYWDITPAAKSWYDSGNNYGLVMTSNADANTKYRTWFSYDDKVAFVVSYRSTNGIEDYYTYQTAGIGNAGTAYFSDYAGQLTLCKQLVTYDSTVNPVSLDLVYNSSYAVRYGEENYDVGGWLGLGMHVGAGVQLSVMQKVEKEELQNDAVSGKKTTYLKYTDGDGTVHYFAKDSSKDSNYYYDEDGLGLKINEYQTGCFKISDDTDNEMYFVNGFLTTITDSNDNEIQIHYTHSDGTSASNGYPNASGDRITKIVQKNKGGSAITVATLTYSDYQWLKTITDAAGNVYSLTHTNDGKLSEIKRGSTVLAKYGANSTRMSYAYDAEAQYGIAFTYNAGKVGSYYEITSASTASKPGAMVEVSHLANGQTCYRDYGKDRTRGNDDNPTGDDILTFYTFDYAGRTVNAYTTNEAKEILGASNAVYSGAGTVDKTNNRTLKTASVGVAGMNILRDYGFELPEVYWTYQGANGSGTHILSKEENPRTGAKACKGWMQAGKTDTIAAYRDTDWLQTGTYTLSAYVSTAQCTNFAGEGVYLQVSGNGVSAKSEAVNYQTSTAVDGGWVRLAVTFTVTTAGKYTIGVYNSGAGPYFFADDFQLEKNNAPSNLNLLENGSMQYWGHGWTMGSLAGFYDDRNAYSIQINGDAYTESCAYQDVPIYQTGQTYVLSGWAKADAVPDNVTKATGDDAYAQDKQKQFGLRAILTYADNSTEYHYVPFNPDVKDWQYTSLAIVPKKANTQVKTIRVVCAYERNCNTAYFDNISLVREAAQTMKYDKDGNLVSVKTTGNNEETSTYSGGNLKTLKTGGNGTFTYTYDDKHNLKTASNGIVTETMTYDSNGNALTATISPKSGTDKIVTTNTYTNSGNQLSTVKQRGAFTTTYNYAGSANKMYGLASSVVDPMGLTVSTNYDAAGRPTTSSVSQSGATKGSVAYQYTKGMLDSLTRTASGSTQTYNFAYDSFGNMTKLQVGSRTLAQYAYASKNGLLEKQTYGNGQYTAFDYDDLNRTTKTTTSSGDSYTYSYAGDGQLHKMEDVASGVTYRYNYDTLGRLIGASQTGEGTSLRASYTYDSDSRLKSISYSIPGLIDSATETYYYNTSTTDNVSDGALEKMALFSDAWIAYRYDSLSRLKERDVGNILTEHQTYLAGSGTCTTTTLPETFYTTALGGSTKLSGFQYAYNAVGNVTKITNLTDNTYKTYAYDSLGQLTQVLEYNSSGTAVNRYNYSYDNAGNIKKWYISDPTGTYIGKEHTYTYGNSDWKDLLTAFDGQSITYDGSGNPLSYYNGKRHTMTWRNGRELNSVTVGGKTYSYEYDVNGLRTRKTNADGTYSDYYWMESMLLAEVQYAANGAFIRTLKFLYDENNTVVGISVKNAGEARFTSYYYAKNLQGDVVAVYRSDYTEAKGYYPTLVASYQYDAYGKVTSVKGSAGTELSLSAYPNHIAHVNPIRYRGYYYDNETGFYYLQSRYYDPVVCRFINADEYSDTDDGLLGFNMFAYCMNNPINRSDPNGSWSLPNWAKVAIGVAVIAVAAAVTVATAGAAGPVVAAVNCAAHGALVGSVTQGAIGAVTGALSGAVKHRITTGSWKGAGQAALDGAADGFMTGAITGAITGAATSGACFIAGTLVQIEDGEKPIEEIKVGDYVWAYDEYTKDTALKRVVETYINETDELMHIFVSGEEIICTPSHPFYSPVKGWTDAVHLRAGDILVLVNGEYVVVEKVQHELLESPVKVYNFQVEDYHTYYVSESGVLVHNICKGETAATKRGRQMHKDWDYGPGVEKEVKIPGYGRADAVDFKNKIIYELKPANKRAMKRGMKQLERYATGLSKQYPGTNWKTFLIAYK